MYSHTVYTRIHIYTVYVYTYTHIATRQASLNARLPEKVYTLDLHGATNKHAFGSNS